MPMSPHRPTLAGILLAIVVAAVLLPATLASAAEDAPQPSSNVAKVALGYLGRYEGECWPWVRQVVAQATGHEMGFDYRDGFFEAGAIEVSLANARDGDIIQVANDNNTTPSADYAGLHTAIVLANNGDGTFTVVDSNSQWDGIVRVREDYDPATAAARYAGLSFHIYRITGVPSSPPPKPAGKGVQQLPAGERGKVNTPGDCLNLRAKPGISEKTIVCMRHGTEFTILGPTAVANGRTWLQVATPYGQGWVAEEFITRIESSAPSSSGGDTKPVLQFRSVVAGLAAQ
jgi:hypothetical protein